MIVTHIINILLFYRYGSHWYVTPNPIMHTVTPTTTTTTTNPTKNTRWTMGSGAVRRKFDEWQDRHHAAADTCYSKISTRNMLRLSGQSSLSDPAWMSVANAWILLCYKFREDSENTWRIDSSLPFTCSSAPPVWESRNKLFVNWDLQWISTMEYLKHSHLSWAMTMLLKTYSLTWWETFGQETMWYDFDDNDVKNVLLNMIGIFLVGNNVIWYLFSVFLSEHVNEIKSVLEIWSFHILLLLA